MRVLLALLFAVTLHAQPVHTLCQACHSEQVQDFLKHPHAAKMLSCDACHGTSIKHREAAGGAPPDRVAGPQEVPALCGGCHSKQKPLFDKSQHAKVLALAGRVKAPSCGTCHGVHAQATPVQIEARCTRCHTPLPPSCKPRCNDCHDPHTAAVRKNADVHDFFRRVAELRETPSPILLNGQVSALTHPTARESIGLTDQEARVLTAIVTEYTAMTRSFPDAIRSLKREALFQTIESGRTSPELERQLNDLQNQRSELALDLLKKLKVAFGTERFQRIENFVRSKEPNSSLFQTTVPQPVPRNP